jgi:hypothetical protein
MFRNLTELNQEQSLEFIEYFNAALRRGSESGLGSGASAKYTVDGYEVLRQSFLVNKEGEKCLISWRLLIDSDNRVISVDTIDNLQEWESYAEQFIGDILFSVLSGKKEFFFRRNYYAVINGSNLMGENWLPHFRFAPQFPDDDSKIANAERLFVIDQEIRAVDEFHAHQLANERSSIAAARLSLILDIGLYQPIHELRWFIKRDEQGKLSQERASTQHIDINCPYEMPSKNTICKTTTFKGSVFDSTQYIGTDLYCPTETRKILKGLDNVKPEVRTAFDKCARLYQLALTIGRNHPTVRLSYECAAIDAIQQELGKKYKGFSDFVRCQLDEDVDYILDFIHSKVRSAHWHGGNFELGETDFNRDISNPQDIVRWNIRLKAHAIFRKAIFTWILREIGDS